MVTQSLLNEPRARQWIEQAGLDAIVACSPANVRYLTGHHIWFNVTFKRHMLDPREPAGLPFCFAVLANGKNPSLVLDHMSETNTADLDVDCYVYGQEKAWELRALEHPRIEQAFGTTVRTNPESLRVTFRRPGGGATCQWTYRGTTWF